MTTGEISYCRLLRTHTVWLLLLFVDLCFIPSFTPFRFHNDTPVFRFSRLPLCAISELNRCLRKSWCMLWGLWELSRPGNCEAK